MRRRTVIASAIGLAAAPNAWAAETPVVLELFTSQGCSSCPPADALLGMLVRRPNVIGLAYHVDYWNRLGWPDPFANRRWTDRQRAYARQLQTEVYTPALVINGSAMVVGSDQHAVAAAMREAADLPVALELRREAAGLVAVIGTPPAGTAALLVIYDGERTTTVGAGENGGRRLREFQIVRDARALDGAAGLIMLPGIGSDQGAALLLRDASGRITGAAEVRPLRTPS